MDVVELCSRIDQSMERIMLKDAEALLDAVSELERLIGRLYECMAGVFPEDSIWAGLAGDEAHHAMMALEMKSLLGGRDWILSDPRLNLSVVKSIQKYVVQQIERTKNNELPRRNAFFIARDLERTLVEKAFHNAFDFGDSRFNEAASGIDEQTRRHLDRLEAVIRDEFPGSG
jgi:hypothetical protein